MKLIHILAQNKGKASTGTGWIFQSLSKIPSLIKEPGTLSGELDIMAGKLYMEPSIHI